MQGEFDYILYALKHANAAEDSHWTVKFTDGDQRGGVLRHLGGTAYILEGNDTIYFSSDQVVRLHLLSKT